jgi:hypothetical protein
MTQADEREAIGRAGKDRQPDHRNRAVSPPPTARAGRPISVRSRECFS